MPKERRKRGRRAEKKRRKEKEDQEALRATERDVFTIGDEERAQHHDRAQYDANTFHGLLTEQETEYFKRADQLLEFNNFSSDGERALFIDNLHKEVTGKELKIAHSQGCSRLLERLIMASTASQLKKLFQALSGHFVGIAQHMFASHCCETLIVKCAPEVSKELESDYVSLQTVGDTPYVSMENLFLYMLNELEPYLKHLVTHRYASHTVRMLLLVLSGRPVSSVKNLVQGKKKENIPLVSEVTVDATASAVPRSFSKAIRKVLDAWNIATTREELRALAVHQLGSPTLQIMLLLETSFLGKDFRRANRTLLTKLTGLDSKDDESGSSEEDRKNFIDNLLHDTVGSRLAEVLVQCAPRREFTVIYKTSMQGRVGSLARNKMAAFVIQKVLERLKGPELREVLKEITPLVPVLIEGSRASLFRTLIQECAKHEIGLMDFAKAMEKSYDCPKQELILRMLRIEATSFSEDEAEKQQRTKGQAQLHGALLAQTMLELPGELNTRISESILAQTPDTLVKLCQHPQASHVIQKSLSCGTPQPIYKRKLLNLLRGRFASLALNTVASHIVDESWNSPMNYRQSIAEELLKEEPGIRESYSGRSVWRNWEMDKYKTSRQQWFAIAHTGQEGGQKSAIDIARERFAWGKESTPDGVRADASSDKRRAKNFGGVGRRQ